MYTQIVLKGGCVKFVSSDGYPETTIATTMAMIA